LGIRLEGRLIGALHRPPQLCLFRSRHGHVTGGAAHARCALGRRAQHPDRNPDKLTLHAAAGGGLTIAAIVYLIVSQAP